MKLQHRHGERGATLVIFSLVIVVLLTFVAFAVDLGQGRFSRRNSQQAADLAALSAGYYMAGNAASGDPEIQPRAACEAAARSAATNLSGFNPTDSAITSFCSTFPVVGDPCPSSQLAPVPLADGGYQLTIAWPVPDADVPGSQLFDPSFSGAGVNDGDEECQRMYVHIRREQETTFAKVIGVPSVTSSADAVVKGGPEFDGEGVAALVVLEREGCQALQRSGQGRVIVKAVLDTSVTPNKWQPGLITSDSAGSQVAYGSGLECSANASGNNSSTWSVFASCSGTNLPGIIAEANPDDPTDAGIIATHADKIGGRGAHCYSPSGPTGINVPATGADPTSRIPADNRFNPSSRRAIDTLHTDAYNAAVGVNRSAVVGSESTDCQPADLATFANVTFNCPGGFRVQNGRTITITGTDVKFIGDVAVAGTLVVDSATNVTIARKAAASDTSAGNTGRLVVTGTASFGKVRNFYIGGSGSACTQVNNCSAISVSGNGASLRINTGAVTTNSCLPGPGANPSAAGPALNWSRVATLGGTVDVASGVTWCQTMLYIGKSTSSRNPADNMVTTGRINCSPQEPCPLISTADSRDRLSISGGNASIFWSAPNQSSTDPDGSSPYEGLSLWVEGTGLNQIKGTGSLITTGVFFLPNARFEFDGQANAANPFNAQFFSRTLNFSGQGDLNLSPDPRDAVKTPKPGSFGLIR